MLISPPRILRLTSPSMLISAKTFEEAFTKHLSGYLKIDVGSAVRFFDDVLGPVGQRRPQREATARLEANVSGTDYVCLDFQSFHLLPLLAALRNRGGMRVRLLVIAHAPGAYLVDWALLRLLLRPGDRVIAPTERARAVIESLCPELGRWVRVVPHPVTSGSEDERRRGGLVFLGRVVEGKVLHRVLDALALLGPTRAGLTLDVVGPLGPTDHEVSPYLRSLVARRNRLGLDEVVRFCGPVVDQAKAEVLAGAGGLVNLSLTLEESFGKSVAEGLASGVPALVTDWDGLPEVAGPCGAAVPVALRPLAVDVEPSVVAEGIEGLLRRPASPAACRESARRFHPETVGPRYRDVLEEALDERGDSGAGADDGPGAEEPAAPSTGLLAGTAPLVGYRWRELYQAVVDESDRMRATLAGAPPGPLTEAGEVRTRLFYGLRRALEHEFAGIGVPPARSPDQRPSPLPGGLTFLDRVEHAVDRASQPGTKVVCLQLLWSNGRHGAVRERLALLRTRGAEGPGAHYLEVESLVEHGRLTDALDLCLAPIDPGWWDEHAAARLCQLAAVALRAGSPDRALVRLRSWTDSYPDGHESGAVWLARARCAGNTGHAGECAAALRAAEQLLGGAAVAPVLAALLAGIEG